LVLAVLVTLLGGYIALFERGSLTSKELDERKGKVLPTFVRDKVTRLTLTRRGKRALLERVPGEEGAPSAWRLLEPVRADADQAAVDQLLGELEWLSARRVLENISEQDRKAFGLTNPSYRLTYQVSGQDHTLHVGKTDVHGESYYVARDAEPTAYVVPKTLIEVLDHDPGHFRGKEFLGSIVSAWAQRLSLTGPHGTLELLKENGRWWLLGEPKSYADPKRAAELLEKLDGIRAVRYLEGEAKEQAFKALAGSERRSVDLRVVPDEHREDKAPERFVLQFADTCPGHAAERVARAGERGDPVCVLAEELAPFEAGEQELRLSRLFAADPSEIERLELSAGSSSLVLKREGENWTAEGQKPDREAVEAWLADLTAQRATGVLSVKDITPDRKLSLALMGDRKLSISADLDEAGQRVLVRRDDEPVLAIFPLALADLLSPFKARFASLEVWAGKQPSQVTGLDARDGSLARKLTCEQGAWRKLGSAAPLKEDQRVRELVRELIKLRVLSVVAEHTRPEHGLATSAAKLTFTLAGAAPPLMLELGARTPRGWYARVDGGPVVQVGAEVQRALHELAGGSPPPLPAAADAGGVEEHEAEDEDEHEHEHAHE
jgi:hypothetical protein